MIKKSTLVCNKVVMQMSIFSFRDKWLMMRKIQIVSVPGVHEEEEAGF